MINIYDVNLQDVIFKMHFKCLKNGINVFLLIFRTKKPEFK